MAEWRTRGYVPDSDEEDDSQVVGYTDVADLPTSQRTSNHGNASDLQAPNVNHESRIGQGTECGEKDTEGAKTPQGHKNEDGQGRTPLRKSTARLSNHRKGPRAMPTLSSKEAGIDELGQHHYELPLAPPSSAVSQRSECSRTPLVDTVPQDGRTPTQPLPQTSLLSSPLTSVPSSPVENIHPVSQDSPSSKDASIAAAQVPHGPHIPITNDLLRTHSPNRPDIDVVTSLQGSAESPRVPRGGRSFRRRNLIQMHPYLIEQEKYDRIMKARGIRPIHITEAENELVTTFRKESPAPYVHSQDDSQVVVGLYSSPTPEISPSPPSSLTQALRSPSRGFPQNVEDEAEELPELAALLRAQPVNYERAGNKRRKTLHTYSEKRKRLADDPEISFQNDAGSTRQAGNTNRNFDVPASPVPSASSPLSPISPRFRKRFKIPQQPPAVGLPTPLTSSEPRRRPVIEFSEDEASSNPDINSGDDVDVDARSDVANSSPLEEPSEDLKRVQKKIRGVLPASWLKLDLKSQLKKGQRTPANIHDASPTRSNSHRGIAKIVSRPRTRSPSFAGEGPVILSDDSSASEENHADSESLQELDLSEQTKIVGVRDVHHHHRAHAHRFDGEAEEDDRVDAMLQSKNRRVGYKKRSQLPAKVFVLAKPKSSLPHAHDDCRSGHYHQPRITDRFDKAIKKPSKFQPPKLSILDAVTIDAPEDNSTLPLFLKIASRTTRMRADQGKHSPTRKTLKLATNSDTTEANKYLREWREGTIGPKATDRRWQRKPLMPRSGNETALRDDQASEKQPSRGKGQTSIDPSTLNQAQRRNKQSTLDQALQRLKPKPNSRKVRKYRFANPLSKPDVRSKRSKISTALLTDNEPRQAMLETGQGNSDEDRPDVAFRRNLVRINRLSDMHRGPEYAPSLSVQGAIHSFSRQEDAHLAPNPPRKGATIAKVHPSSRRIRKRPPKHVDINLPSYQQASESPASEKSDDISDYVIKASRGPQGGLVGFERFGGQYPITFDVKPLPKDTYFHHTTFIGRGDFNCSIESFYAEDMNKPRGFSEVTLLSRTFKWGQWNEEVSSEIETVLGAIVQSIKVLSSSDDAITAASESAVGMQKRLVNYFSSHLSFVHPVDRIHCAERCTNLLTLFLEELIGLDTAAVNVASAYRHESVDMKIQIGTLNLVLTHQLSRIAEHELVPREMLLNLFELKTRTARYVLTLALRDRLSAFFQCSETFRPVQGSAYSVRNEYVPVQALVICRHLLSNSQNSLMPFWEVVNEVIFMGAGVSNDVRYLEKCWQSLFVLLPFLEFNSKGVIETGLRFKAQCDNWVPVKQMISRVLEVYSQASYHQHPTLNTYCRALFGRCLHLISDWNWAKCEGVIGTMFDFFARNKLSHLRNESCHGSPPFLGNLANNPSLDLAIGDKSFHIFLKTLAKGLLKMRGVYPAKRIRDIIWRLMPNHGRYHPKEEAIRQEDLDALRNHHDLLSTLYWTSPPEFRPRLTAMRNLVNVESSHREACHLNIRTWSNLVRFQISTQEQLASLTPFADWHNDLMVQLLRQHRLARSEAEQQVQLSEHNDGLTIGKELLESTISRNQRQVEAVMGDALVSLKLAISATIDCEAVRILLTPAIMPTLGLLSVTRPQANTVVKQTLDVILYYSLQLTRYARRYRSKNSNDDSQDYGDWSFAEDEESSSKTSQETDAIAHVQSIAEKPLRHLLSDAFGADSAPHDDLLAKIIDSWIAVASTFVRYGLRSWNDYLGPFGQDSWNSLRATQQTRRFTAYFLARILETDKEVYVEHREFFLRSWIESLVEQESLLKFQNRVTGAMLNIDSANPLLRNLPFWADKATGQYNITASDFSLRRLSLISSVLSNMRESIDSGIAAPELKQEWKGLVKHLMHAMKHNYQELGPASNVRGAYVDFAQRVVEFLQQHTSAICPVDRFFTDSIAFPLPVTDPLYVVGQLKNYGLRLQDPRIPKQLAAFLQSVSERAATEGQQQYLVGQLYAAMSGGFELGGEPRPTLRAFLIRAIIPAYIESCITSPTGWILLLPYLQALRPVFHDLLNYLDGTNSASIESVTAMIDPFMQSLCTAFQHLVDYMSFLEKPHLLHILSEAFSAVTALLPTIDYIIRLNGPIEHTVHCLHYLLSFASFITTTSTTIPNLSPCLTARTKDPLQDPYVPARHFAAQELQHSLIDWKHHDGRYYLQRGHHTSREIVVPASCGSGSLHDESKRYGVVVNKFLERVDGLVAFRGKWEEVDGERGERMGLDLGALVI